MKSRVRYALLAATLLTAGPVLAQVRSDEVPGSSTDSQAASLDEQFLDPPLSARPRVWWHWMNGNITEDGIEKDLAWMKRVGIGGLQNFDANLNTPQIVDKRLVYMTPEWKNAFRFAASRADDMGLELAIASSPGWSETGGPWVKPEDGLKKLVWSETQILGGRKFTGRLAPPSSVTGPFQTIRKAPSVGEQAAGTATNEPPRFYADVAVLAIPEPAAIKIPAPSAADNAGKTLDAALLIDADFSTGFDLKRGGGQVPSLTLSYPAPQTIRSATIFMPGAAVMYFGSSYLPRIEASDDGASWRTVTDVALSQVPTTVSFPEVTARKFRLVVNPAKASYPAFTPAPGVDLSAAVGAAPAMAKGPRVTEFRLSPSTKIDRSEVKAAFDLVTDYYALSKDVPEVQGVAPGKVIDLTARMRADGTMDWTPPPGRWRLLRMGYSLTGTTNHPATPEATGLEVDKFDGPAVRRYLDHYLGLYKDAAGADLIGSHGVRAILTDSIEVGASNWTPQLIAQFRRLRGYDPMPWLPTLTGVLIGSRTQSDRFLYDFRRTLADLMASEHYGTIANVAHEHGLTVYNEALEDRRPSLGDDMAMRRYADVPMAAMWTFTRAAGPKPTYLADIKGAASVAHIYGQNLVAAESLTTVLAPWAFGPADLKRVIDLEFVTGVNRPIIHTSVHVPVDDKIPGLSLSVTGQYFNRNENWAEMAKPWVDYIARNGLMLQQGRNVADLGYFYGEEAPLTGLYGDTPVADAPKHYGYDFVNADALTGALSNDGADIVTTGGARYKALYLGGSSRRMTLPVLQKLADLVEGGGTVIGLQPAGNPGLAGDGAAFDGLVAKLWPGGQAAQVGKGKVIASTDVEAGLKQIGITPDFCYDGGQADSEILFAHRRFPGGDGYFVVNRKDRAETIEARFRVSGKVPEVWHAETGTSERVSYRIDAGETIVPLTLSAEEAVHVVFRRPATTANAIVERPVMMELSRLAGPWQVTFQPDRGAPASTILSHLAPLNENADPAIKYFSGMATYSMDFAAPKGWKPGAPLWLDLGEAREIAEVSLNGRMVGSVWHAPYRLDVGAQAKRGRNHIDIKVANLWVNRLVGDAQPGAKPITWTAGATYRPSAPLRPSGLIGPVVLLGAPTNR